MLADAADVGCDAAAAAAVVTAAAADVVVDVAAAAPPSAPSPALDGDDIGDNDKGVGLSMPRTLLRPVSGSDSCRSEPARLLEEPINDIRLPESRSGLRSSSSSDNVLHGATTAGRRSGIRDRSSPGLALAVTFPLLSSSPLSSTSSERADGRAEEAAGDPDLKSILLCGGGQPLLLAPFFARSV